MMLPAVSPSTSRPAEPPICMMTCLPTRLVVGMAICMANGVTICLDAVPGAASDHES